MNDIYCFQSAAAYSILPIWSQMQVTAAANYISNITVSSPFKNVCYIKFALDFVDGASNGWKVVMTTNYKLDNVMVRMTDTKPLPLKYINTHVLQKGR